MAERLFALLQTNHGPIEVELFANHAPKTVRNFVGLADGRAASGPTRAPGRRPRTASTTAPIFHRVIAGFMIQGGDPLGTGTGGPGYNFKDEFHPELQFDRPYLLAMANAGPGTNGSQFFITVGADPAPEPQAHDLRRGDRRRQPRRRRRDRRDADRRDDRPVETS